LNQMIVGPYYHFHYSGQMEILKMLDLDNLPHHHKYLMRKDLVKPVLPDW